MGELGWSSDTSSDYDGDGFIIEDVVASNSEGFIDLIHINNFSPGGYLIERLDDNIWTGIQSIYAYGADSYQVLVPTLSDSISVSDGMAEYRVIAAMSEGLFVSLEPAFGYSVDNIAPPTPTVFSGSFDESSGAAILSWNPSDANDISHYNIYKGSELYNTTPESSFSEAISEDSEYSVSAVDIHENESQISDPVIVAYLDIAEQVLPTHYNLEPAYPNPFNPQTTIEYAVPEYNHVLIEIFNINGHRVEIIENSIKEPGYYSYTWDASRYGSGLYMVRMQSDTYVQVHKLMFLK